MAQSCNNFIDTRSVFHMARVILKKLIGLRRLMSTECGLEELGLIDALHPHSEVDADSSEPIRSCDCESWSLYFIG